MRKKQTKDDIDPKRIHFSLTGLGMLAFIFILLTSIGYAALNTELTISGEASFSPKVGKREPNAPTLTSNMIPIKWNGSAWVKADEKNPTNNRWYNYEDQIWANAVTVTSSSRSSYQAASVETVINESDVLTYMVWIPRYEYKYTNLGTAYAGGTALTPGEIAINFIKGTSTTSITDYKINPAFTFGSEELTGFWAGKFETTGSITDITIKPNITALRTQSISAMFNGSIAMDEAGNKYGYTSATDVHMMKNSEWGAVAYLTQSSYGKYGNNSYSGASKEVYTNNSSSFFTGKSCGGPGSLSGVCGTSTANGTYSYHEDKNGTGASTTGNIYGVYDMSGGTSEFVVGNYSGTTGSSGFDPTWFTSNTKYYDNYTTSIGTTACLGGTCYGHALSETAGWYSDSALYVTNLIPWFVRGGRNFQLLSGIFYFDTNPGAATPNATFRITHK